jgi:prophage regulatory protein
MSDNILRLPAVKKITGLSRSCIYAMIDKEQFPKQVSIGMRAVGWLENEIRDWVKTRAALRNAK